MFIFPTTPEEFARLSGYKFNNPKLLAQALTRKSATTVRQHNGIFQVSEFVGDSVLGLVIAKLLVKFNPEANEGELTRLKNKLVNNKGPLARVARHLGLNKMIMRAQNDNLDDKKLSDHMEAVLYAIFVDCDENYKIIETFIARHWTLLGLNEDCLSVSDFGGESLVGVVNTDQKRSEQADRALFTAIRDGLCEKMELLLRNGASVVACDTDGNTPLWVAFCSPQWQMLAECLIQDYHANIDATNRKKQTLLHIYANSGDEKKVEYLLDNFAEVNFPDENGHSPLHHAAYKGHMSIVTKLVIAEANIDAIDTKGRTAAELAAQNDKLIVASYLTDESKKRNRPSIELFNLIINAKIYEIAGKEQAILDLIDQGAKIFTWRCNNKTIFELLYEQHKNYQSELLIKILAKVMPVPNANLMQIKLSHQIIRGINFSESNLEGADFTCAKFENVLFVGARLINAKLAYCTFKNVKFTNTDMRNLAALTDATMDKDSFLSLVSVIQLNRFSCSSQFKIKLVTSDSAYNSPKIIDLRGVNLSGIALSDIEYSYLRFDETTLASMLTNDGTNKISLRNVDLRGLDLSHLNLENVCWSGACIDRKTLVSLIPQLKAKKINLKGVQILSPYGGIEFNEKMAENLDGLDLSDTDLSGVDFSGASLRKTKLLRSILRDTHLSGCDFQNADVTETDFSGARVDGKSLKSLTGCLSNKKLSSYKINIAYGDICHIDLSRLDLSDLEFRSNLHWADLRNSKLNNVKFGFGSINHVDFRNADLSNADLSQIHAASENIYDNIIVCGAKISVSLLQDLLIAAKQGKLKLQQINCSGLYLADSRYAINFDNVDITGANFSGASIKMPILLSLLPHAEKGSINLTDIKIIDPISTAELTALIPYAKKQLIKLTHIKFKNIQSSEELSILTQYAREGLISLASIQLGEKREYSHFHQTIGKRTFKNIDFSGLDLSNANMNSVIFENVNVTGTIFTGARLQEVTFNNSIGLTAAQLVQTAAFSVTCPDKSIVTEAMRIKTAAKQSLVA